MLDHRVHQARPRSPPWSGAGCRRRRSRPGCRGPRAAGRRCPRTRQPRSSGKGQARRCLPPASTRTRSIARSTISSTETAVGVLEWVVGLQTRELDDLLHQTRQALALRLHPGSEPEDRLGVLGASPTASASRLKGANRGLELVADVRDEVSADRVDASLAGPVLHQDQHQPAAEGRHPGGDVEGRPGPVPPQNQLPLPDLAVATYQMHHLEQIGHVEPRTSHHPEHVSRCARLEHLVTRTDDERRRPQDGKHCSHPRWDKRLGHRRCAPLIALAEAPRENGDGAEQHTDRAAQQERRGRLHDSIVRRHAIAVGTRAAPRSCPFRDCSPCVHVATPTR